MKFYVVVLLAIVVNSCPDDDELCLSCNMNTCLMCSNSYVDPSTGKCKVPSEHIPNCV